MHKELLFDSDFLSGTDAVSFYSVKFLQFLNGGMVALCDF